LDTAHFHQVMDVSTRANVLSGVNRRLHLHLEEKAESRPGVE
jgi:hypothetical protein